MEHNLWSRIKTNALGILLMAIILIPTGLVVILVIKSIFLGPKKAFANLPNWSQCLFVGLAVIWFPMVYYRHPEELEPNSEQNSVGWDYKIDGRKITFAEPPKPRETPQLFLTNGTEAGIGKDSKRYHVKPEINGKRKTFTIQGPNSEFDKNSKTQGVGYQCRVYRLCRNWAIGKSKFDENPLKYASYNNEWRPRQIDGYRVGSHKATYMTVWTCIIIALGFFALMAGMQIKPSQHSHQNQA